MAVPSTPDFRTLRADHVGSLLRPDRLKEAIAGQHQGHTTGAQLRSVQDEAIREAVARQEAADFPIVTDGEFRRVNWQDSFGASVSGYGGEERPIVNRVPTVDRLRPVRNQLLDEFRFTRSITTRPVKVTLVSPDRISQRFEWESSGSVYKGLDDFMGDVVAIERQMIAELVDAGCRYVQMDAPSYTAYVDQKSLAEMRARGEDPDLNMQRSMAADNAVIGGFAGVTFGIHLCRGNTAAHLPQPRQGSYDAIAERLFNTLQHDRFLLEYDDTERVGGFEPLRFVPRGKVVVLGLVSTKLRQLEAAEDLKRRIDEASKYLAVEQLALSPQCGFSSSLPLGPNRLSDDEQWRKLERIVEVTRQVWR